LEPLEGHPLRKPDTKGEDFAVGLVDHEIAELSDLDSLIRQDAEAPEPVARYLWQILTSCCNSAASIKSFKNKDIGVRD